MAPLQPAASATAASHGPRETPSQREVCSASSSSATATVSRRLATTRINNPPPRDLQPRQAATHATTHTHTASAHSHTDRRHEGGDRPPLERRDTHGAACTHRLQRRAEGCPPDLAATRCESGKPRPANPFAARGYSSLPPRVTLLPLPTSRIQLLLDSTPFTLLLDTRRCLPPGPLH